MKSEVNNRCHICKATKSNLLFNIKYPEFRYPGIFSIRKCKECGLLYNSPRLDDKNLSELYDRNYYFFNRPDSTEFKRIINIYKRTVALVKESIKSKKVLEIGSAKGYLLAVLAKLGWETFGIEISKTATEYAKTKFGIDCFTGTLADYIQQPRKKKYPLVLAIDVVEHVPYPAKFISDITNVVEDNGILIIDTPNAEADNIKTLKKSFSGFNPFHIYLFSIKNITTLLEENGFIVEKTFSYGNTSLKKPSLRYRLKPLFDFLHISNIVYRIYLSFRNFKANKTDNESLNNLVEKLKKSSDYFSQSDSQSELAYNARGNNIVVIARKSKKN